MTAFLEQLCAANSETTGARHPRCRTAPSHDSTTTRHMSRANMAGDAEDACYGSDTCPYGGDASCERSAPARVSRSVCRRLLCKSKRGHARAASNPCLYQPPEHTIHSGAPADEHLACISLTCSVCARKCRPQQVDFAHPSGCFPFYPASFTQQPNAKSAQVPRSPSWNSVTSTPVAAFIPRTDI